MAWVNSNRIFSGNCVCDFAVPCFYCAFGLRYYTASPSQMPFSDARSYCTDLDLVLAPVNTDDLFESAALFTREQ